MKREINFKSYTGPCECGKAHNLFVQNILIEAGAVSKLPHLIHELVSISDSEICIICDDHTYPAAGQLLEELLGGCFIIQLPSEGLHADNHAVKITDDQLNNNIKLLLAVGSGTIHDITRYLANKRNIPFVSVPTAASVDGFVSTVAAMTWNGLKITFPAVSPILVIADTDIFSKAPYRLTASGISDLLGKYTALADWEISHLVTGESFCTKIYNMEIQAMQEVISCISDLRADVSDDKRLRAYESLMYGLLLSGIAMQMMGNSRPASGAEHHISHLWEMEVINDHIDAYHGEKVSVGLMIAIRTYHRAKAAISGGNRMTHQTNSPAGNYRIKPYQGLEKELLQTVFSPKGLYEGVINENTPDPLANIDLKHFENVLPNIAAVLEKLPSEQELYQILDQAGCIKSIEEVGFDESMIEKVIALSPYVRNRLTFMRLLKLLEF